MPAAEFIRAAQVVSGVELSLPVVKLAFRIFDSNGTRAIDTCRLGVSRIPLPNERELTDVLLCCTPDNGTLDRTELFKVLEMRNVVDLQQVSERAPLCSLLTA